MPAPTMTTVGCAAANENRGTAVAAVITPATLRKARRETTSRVVALEAGGSNVAQLPRAASRVRARCVRRGRAREACSGEGFWPWSVDSYTK